MLSVSKVTRNLCCFMAFFPNVYIFQDLFNVRVMEIGKEEDGLYLILNQPSGKVVAITLAAQACIVGNKVDIAPWHRRLGHVSSSVLFSCIFSHISSTIKKCSIFLCAKQYRALFPPSSNKSTNAFDMIHVDVRPPTKLQHFMVINIM